MTTPPRRPTNNQDAGPPPLDDLDTLLRDWHQRNASVAAAGRDRLMASLRSEPAPASLTRTVEPKTSPRLRFSLARVFWSPQMKLAASLLVAVVLVTMLLPGPNSVALAQVEVLVPDGGRLDARDRDGNLLGPCPLKHTDVEARVTGRFSRVTVRQQYTNTYDRFIEAVYTFPLSHRGAVDRMTMTIGDRVIVGEVKEKAMARRIYRQAIESGFTASLLEQERPNIFTQTVGNIPPGATISIEISYVEMLQTTDGRFRFEFPMVVAPRYIPGRTGTSPSFVPAELDPAPGVVLLGPSSLRIVEHVDGAGPETLTPGRLGALLAQSQAIKKPDATWWGTTDASTTTVELPGIGLFERPNDQGYAVQVSLGMNHGLRAGEDVTLILDSGEYTVHLTDVRPNQALGTLPEDLDTPPALVGTPARLRFTPPPTPNQPTLWTMFEARYANGSTEIGRLYADGTGWLNQRWFYTDPARLPEMGAGFAQNTDQVADASRITPMPVPPDTRAGHDISVTVTIDTGGPGVRDLASELHEIDRVDRDAREGDGLPRQVTLALKSDRDIPNRDFLLSWGQTEDTIEEAVFAHASDAGKFFTVMIAPPKRVKDIDARPREMVFVLDCSGSMKGFPIDKAKEVLVKALKTMRERDSFNIVTFNNSVGVLWDEPRAFTDENLAEAVQYVESRQGGGGTEMKPAVLKALEPSKNHVLTPSSLANLPADGREVIVRVGVGEIANLDADGLATRGVIGVREDLTIAFQAVTSVMTSFDDTGEAKTVRVTGTWQTDDGVRTLHINDAAIELKAMVDPMRIVFFLTDGEIGNDMAVVEAVKTHRKITRVFSVGIGDSPNRYLMDAMSKAGRGVADFITTSGDADALVDRFVRRVETPVLTDIEIEIAGGKARITDCIPPLDAIPDLYDEDPIIIHGRYTNAVPDGRVVVRGQTGRGAYEKVMTLALPDVEPDHDVLPTLWARAKVDEIIEPHLESVQNNQAPDGIKNAVVALGEEFGLLTQFTSFVAVEKAKVNVDGRPMLVAVPVEYPHGMTWEGVFGTNQNELLQDASWRLLSEGRVEEAAERLNLARYSQTRQAEAGSPVRYFGEVDARRKSFAALQEEVEKQVALRAEITPALSTVTATTDAGIDVDGLAVVGEATDFRFQHADQTTPALREVARGLMTIEDLALTDSFGVQPNADTTLFASADFYKYSVVDAQTQNADVMFLEYAEPVTLGLPVVPAQQDQAGWYAGFEAVPEIQLQLAGLERFETYGRVPTNSIHTVTAGQTVLELQQQLGVDPAATAPVGGQPIDMKGKQINGPGRALHRAAAPGSPAPKPKGSTATPGAVPAQPNMSPPPPPAEGAPVVPPPAKAGRLAGAANPPASGGGGGFGGGGGSKDANGSAGQGHGGGGMRGRRERKVVTEDELQRVQRGVGSSGGASPGRDSKAPVSEPARRAKQAVAGDKLGDAIETDKKATEALSKEALKDLEDGRDNLGFIAGGTARGTTGDPASGRGSSAHIPPAVTPEQVKTMTIAETQQAMADVARARQLGRIADDQTKNRLASEFETLKSHLRTLKDASTDDTAAGDRIKPAISGEEPEDEPDDAANAETSDPTDVASEPVPPTEEELAAARLAQADGAARLAVASLVHLRFTQAAQYAAMSESLDPDNAVASALLDLIKELGAAWRAKGESGFIADGWHLMTPRLIVVAADLSADHPDAARVMAEVLTKLRAQDETAKALAAALASDTVDAGAVQAASASAAASIDTERRALRVLSNLAPDLRAIALDESKASETIRVTVLVTAADRATAKALEAAGLTIEHRLESMRLIIGTASGSDLEAVAVATGVRRVEPLQARASRN